MYATYVHLYSYFYKIKLSQLSVLYFHCNSIVLLTYCTCTYLVIIECLLFGQARNVCRNSIMKYCLKETRIILDINIM